MSEDLVFRAADPLSGGREIRYNGQIEQQARVFGSGDEFQTRYAIRHRWQGPVRCSNPDYERWGPPRSTQTRNAGPLGLALGVVVVSQRSRRRYRDRPG